MKRIAVISLLFLVTSCGTTEEREFRRREDRGRAVSQCGYDFMAESGAALEQQKAKLEGKWVTLGSSFRIHEKDGRRIPAKDGYVFLFETGKFGAITFLFRDLFATAPYDSTAPESNGLKISRPLSGHGYEGFRAVEFQLKDERFQICRTTFYKFLANGDLYIPFPGSSIHFEGNTNRLPPTITDLMKENPNPPAEPGNTLVRYQRVF